MVKNKHIKIPRKKPSQDKYYLLVHEQKMLESHYDFLSCKLRREKATTILTVKGKYNQTGTEYIYEITYDGICAPKVKILSPTLIPDPPHVYKDGSLCLYYPKEQPWICSRNALYSHIIPWTHEWILYYEIYLINGKWEHPEVKHSDPK